MKTDRSAILAAALAIVDEEGIEGLSLRALGQRLGVSHMAAYRHFADKDAIIDALADQLLAGIRLEDPASVTDLDELVLGYIFRARAALLEHPALVPVIAARPLLRATAPDDLVRLYDTFRAIGFPDDDVVPSILSLVSVTLGLILYEQQRASYDSSRGGRYGRRRRQLVAALDAQDHVPEPAAEMPLAFGDREWAEQVFARTISDCWDGLRRRAGLPVR